MPNPFSPSTSPSSAPVPPPAAPPQAPQAGGQGAPVTNQPVWPQTPGYSPRIPAGRFQVNPGAQNLAPQGAPQAPSAPFPGSVPSLSQGFPQLPMEAYLAAQQAPSPQSGAPSPVQAPAIQGTNPFAPQTPQAQAAQAQAIAEADNVEGALQAAEEGLNPQEVAQLRQQVQEMQAQMQQQAAMWEQAEQQRQAAEWQQTQQKIGDFLGRVDPQQRPVAEYMVNQALALQQAAYQIEQLQRALSFEREATLPLIKERILAGVTQKSGVNRALLEKHAQNPRDYQVIANFYADLVKDQAWQQRSAARVDAAPQPALAGANNAVQAPDLMDRFRGSGRTEEYIAEMLRRGW